MNAIEPRAAAGQREVTAVHVWNCLRQGISPDVLLRWIDVRHHAAFRETELELRRLFREVEKLCWAEFREDFPNRERALKYFQTCQFPQILERMYDELPHAALIWEAIRVVLEPRTAKKPKTRLRART